MRGLKDQSAKLCPLFAAHSSPSTGENTGNTKALAFIADNFMVPYNHAGSLWMTRHATHERMHRIGND
jgi:hypothetical protein